jgi:hypothetical protein
MPYKVTHPENGPHPLTPRTPLGEGWGEGGVGFLLGTAEGFLIGAASLFK